MWKSEKLGKVHFERKKSSWIKYVKKCERGKNTPQVCQKNEIKTVEDFSSCRIVSKVQKVNVSWLLSLYFQNQN